MAHSAMAVLKSNVVNVSPPISATECPRARSFTQHSAELVLGVMANCVVDAKALVAWRNVVGGFV